MKQEILSWEVSNHVTVVNLLLYKFWVQYRFSDLKEKGVRMLQLKLHLFPINPHLK